MSYNKTTARRSVEKHFKGSSANQHLRSDNKSPLEEQFKTYKRKQYKLPLEVADKHQH
jgi:hypothetical protein